MYYALIRAFQKWYQAQQRDGYPSFFARIIRDIQRSTSQSGGSDSRAPSSGNLPTRPLDMDFSDSGGSGYIKNLVKEDFLALGISLEFINRIGEKMESGQIATMDWPKADIRKYFTALEVLTGQKLCPDCGFSQPEANRDPSCLNCGVTFEASPFLDGMKARSERDFLAMNGIEFEHEVARLFTLRGYQMQVTQASRDGGIDIVGSAPGIGNQKVAVQCKRYATTTIGIAEIQRFWGIIAASEYATGFFVTTSSFTSDSLQFAKDKPRLVLIDGRELQKWRSV